MAPNEKLSARKRLARAVREGKLVRPEVCVRCSSRGDIHAHHADYSQPLEVEWLCRSCHVKEHRGDQSSASTRRQRPKVYYDPDLLATLRTTQAEFEKWTASANALRDERDCMIRTALTEGWTHARIAEATGLTRGRIGQIALMQQ